MTKRKNDFTGFVNSKNKSNRIFSREDIGSMSNKEFKIHENAIDYQLNTIGIPSISELQNSDGVVYVNSYKRDDGTFVRDYYRSLPEGSHSSASANKILKGRIYKGEPPKEEPPKTPAEVAKDMIKIIIEVYRLIRLITGHDDSVNYVANNDQMPVAVQQQKAAVEKSINTARTSLEKEKMTLNKMLEDISKAFKSGASSTQKVYDYSIKKTAYDNAQNAVERIDAFNKNNMIQELKDEVEKIQENTDIFKNSEITKDSALEDLRRRYKPELEIKQKTASISRINKLPDINPAYADKSINKSDSLIDNARAKILLDNINYDQNIVKNNRPDAYELMKHSIFNLKDISETPHCRLIDSSANLALSKELNVEVPKGWQGILYESESRIAKNIAKDKEFRDAIKNNKPNLTLNNDANLRLSINKARIRNVNIDKDGNFSCIIYDDYDFSVLYKKYLSDPVLTWANNIALFLQFVSILEKYYILIHIKIPKEEFQKIKNGK